MTPHRSAALVLLATGLGILIATRPLALLGLSPLPWNAIYPLGLIAGSGCVVIGLYRLIKGRA